MKEARGSLTYEHRLSCSTIICSEIQKIIPVSAVTMVYAAKEPEVETKNLISELI